MNEAKSIKELKEAGAGVIEFTPSSVKVLNWERLRETFVDKLAWTVAFSSDAAAKNTAVWLIRHLAQQAGNGPASINEVYMARGKGQLPSNFTVPAINVRAASYYFGRAVMRAAKRHEASAVIFELSRSEMGYTNQSPAEYASSILAAALREGYPWPVFIQGDHYQVNASKYHKDSKAELDGIMKLSLQSMEAGFFNIDIDTSTLVDLEKKTLAEQQKLNCESCAALSAFIRKNQPSGVNISLGGEIGEVGLRNSTVEELEAFMDGYNALAGKGAMGLSKISVQTGTAHGGIVLPDGTMAKVKVDFDVLGKLSEVGRTKYGMAGAVQHGASTLPMELFDKFPQVGTAEIHLATEFQNILYEHPNFPAELKEKMYDFLAKECAGERKSTDTDSQFQYKTRKKALGPFKKELWSLPDSVMNPVMTALQEKVDLLFRKLNILGTGPLIKPFVKIANVAIAPPSSASGSKIESFDGAD